MPCMGPHGSSARLLVLDGSLSPEKLKQIQLLLTVNYCSDKVSDGLYNCMHVALEFQVFGRCFSCFILARLCERN